MKEQNDQNRRDADRFVKSVSGESPQDIELEKQVQILRGVTCYLLKELQKVYVNLSRHAVAHDGLLNRDMGTAINQTQEMMDIFFPDLIQGAEETEDDDGKSD